MEKIRKISLIIVLILILGIGFSLETYAAINCNVSMSSTSEVDKGDEFEVAIGISNIQAEKGILIFGGTVEYDSDVLTYLGKSSEGNWSVSYNSANGKFVADRDDGFATSNENVLKLKFKVNENAEGKTNITVKNALISDAQEEENVSGISKTVSIKAIENDNTNQGGETNVDNKPNLDNKPSSSNKPTTPTVSNSTNKKPNNNTTNNVVNNTVTDSNQNNEVNIENANNIVGNILDNQNTTIDKTNNISNSNEEIGIQSKSRNSIPNIVVISIVAILVIIVLILYIKKRKK